MVTRIDWENPHVFFYVDAADADGAVVNWKCETRGPNGLQLKGWRRDSLKAEDKVIGHGFLAGTYNVTVTYNNTAGPLFQTGVLAAKPALLTQDSSGSGLALVQNYVSATDSLTETEDVNYAEFTSTTTAGEGTFTVPPSVLTQMPKVANSLISGPGPGYLVIATGNPVSFSPLLTAGGTVSSLFGPFVGTAGTVAYQ
jgi:Family of unknown function (DUF6152)